MLVKGNKIRLTKPLAGLSVGTEFEIIDITESGVIEIKSHIGYGYMSYGEYSEYFEKVEVLKKPKEWVEGELSIGYYTIKNELVYTRIKYKHDGIRVIIKDNKTGIKASSKCCSSDTFDFNTGFYIAKLRLISKLVDREAKLLISKL